MTVLRIVTDIAHGPHSGCSEETETGRSFRFRLRASRVESSRLTRRRDLGKERMSLPHMR
jgi:hypothetical protein